jgi:hypothetical protein
MTNTRTVFLPTVQEQDGGGLYGLSTPFTLPPLLLHMTASQMWAFMAIQPCLHHHYLLACNSKSEVVCMAFWLCLCCCHLSCMQQQAGPWAVVDWDQVCEVGGQMDLLIHDSLNTQLPILILTCMFYDVSYIYLCLPPVLGPKFT